MRSAAEGGYLEVIQWAREDHAPWGEETCNKAALGGHLELKWAREHDCPWGIMTCASPLRADTLGFCSGRGRHDCPWGTDTCAFAAKYGYL